MAIEIERKFLVTGTGWKGGESIMIIQGYLNLDKERTVRVRLVSTRGFLTLTLPTTKVGGFFLQRVNLI